MEFTTKIKNVIKQIKETFYEGQIISRDQLYSLLKEKNPEFKQSTFGWIVYELKQSNILQNIKRSVYQIGNKPEFNPYITDKQKRIFQIVRKKNISDNICLWSTEWLHSFMVHQPMNRAIILEVDADTIQSVYHFMRDGVYKKVYMSPNVDMVQNYAMEDDEPVILSKFVTRSPIFLYEKVVIPKLEKILVDVFVEDKRFFWLQGQELINIFKSSIEQNHINYSTMITYASRREVKKQLKSFLIEKIGISKNVIE